MEEVEGELFSGISDVKYEQEILVGSSILVGEGNGNLLQYSCLENCRDGGAWWAAVYGVAQSRTQLKRLSSSSSSSVLVGNLSMKLGVEMCVEVTVGMGFGAMNVDRFSCMDRVRRES